MEAPQPEYSFPSGARDRLAVTSWPFRAYMESPGNRNRKPNFPGMDMKEFPAFVAKTFDVYNINPLIRHFAATTPDYLEAFREAVVRARSHVVDLGLPGARVYDADAKVRSAVVAAGREWIDIAVAVGSPSVRLHVNGAGKPNVGLAADSLGQLAEYGSSRNVAVNLENDDPVSEDPFFLVAVIEKVNSPFLRALPDFGNSLLAHDADYNVRAMKAMLPHAWNMCHVKDMVETENGETRTVDLNRMFELAQSSGFRGFYSMELDVRSSDPVPGTKRLIDTTLKCLQQQKK